MKRLLTLLPVLLVALSAHAVVNAGGDQFGPPPDDPGFNNVGTTVTPGTPCGGSGLGGVYMGNGWVLTPQHVGASDMCFNGNRYSWDGNAPVQPTYAGYGIEMIMFRLEHTHPWPNEQDPTIYPLITIISQTPSIGTTITLIGNGPGNGGQVTQGCPSGDTCWAWKGETQKTWGHAKVNYINTPSPPLIAPQFATLFAPAPATDTAAAAIGDSGGGMFVKDPTSGIWMLAGVIDGDNFQFCAGKGVSAQGCDETSTYDLSQFRSQILPYLPVDTDGDGIPDQFDNCPYTFNPDQKNSGGIGYGSPPDSFGDACQCGDVTGDGIVDIGDKTILSKSLACLPPYGSVEAMPGYDKCDVNGDGTCDTGDLTIISQAIAGLGGIPQKCKAAVCHSPEVLNGVTCPVLP